MYVKEGVLDSINKSPFSVVADVPGHPGHPATKPHGTRNILSEEASSLVIVCLHHVQKRLA